MDILRLGKPLKDLLVPNEPGYHRVRFGPCRGCVLWLNPADRFFVLLGLLEPELRPHFRALHEGSVVCFDVGAADGYYTLAMARGAGTQRVVAFEPDETRAEQLMRTVQRNAALAPKVQVRKDALGRQADGRGMTTIDSVTQGGPAPDLLKVDVEGHEEMVLAGGARTIETRRPRILLEFHSAELEAACRARLEAAGYDVATVRPGHRWARSPPRLHRGWLVAVHPREPPRGDPRPRP